MNSSRRYNSLSLIFKVLIFVSCILGILFNSFRSLKTGISIGSSFYYYTIQTNIFTGAMSLLFFILMLRNKRDSKIPQFMYLLKYLSTSAITLTFIVFSAMLAPLMPRDYLLSGSNIFLHNITPLLAIADFIFFDTLFLSKLRYVLFTTIVPLAYTFITLIFSFSGIRFHEGSVAPYFFLDYEKYGWFTLGKQGIGVVIWVLLISVLVIALGFTILICNRKIRLKVSES